MEPGQAGFYSTERRAVQALVARKRKQQAPNGDGAHSGKTGPPSADKTESESEPPFCDRCHQLLHHQTGVPVHHPSIESIYDTILESPYKYNHIYHVIDAADFPLSLIPHIHDVLSLSPQRGRNRRSKAAHFMKGRKDELSFVITRSDLLAPRKEQVDALMPYLTEVLREALGEAGKNIRLGNVRCVSAKRGWWTKELKEDIWRRGGGGWMVGKVNVGKSNLFEAVFPKGRGDNPLMEHDDLQDGQPPSTLLGGDQALPESQIAVRDEKKHGGGGNLELDPDSLLPPLQPEQPYPVMPLVSALPGTTASPIRLSYGNGRGELIDLPGLARTDLDQFVKPESRLSLIMRQHMRPKQYVIKPGQSLLLGRLIRISPQGPYNVVLAYPFVPLPVHVTATEKAVRIERDEVELNVPSVVDPDADFHMDCAGEFPLKWDVTRQRTGPLTRASAVGLKPEQLPFRVLATDILIEGCGWVELVVQVRRRALEHPEAQGTAAGYGFGAPRLRLGYGRGEGADDAYPIVNVYSPGGKFIGARKPMNAWLLATEHEPGGKKRGDARPRRSMKGMKKMEKLNKRQLRQQSSSVR